MFRSCVFALAMSAATVTVAATPALRAGFICPAGQTDVSVEGNDHIFCVTGQPSSGNSATGVCPEVYATYLSYGSHCALVRTKVYGSRAWADAAHTKTAPNPDALNCAADCAPVSVVGADKAYCVKQPMCSGSLSTSACPGTADGLAANTVCIVPKRV